MQISETGMSLYAGIQLSANDLIEVEFHSPPEARLQGVIRNCSGYCFGVEFLTRLPVDTEAAPPASQDPVESLPASTARVFEEIKKVKGTAMAYVILAHVLQSLGKDNDAQGVLAHAIASFRATGNAFVSEKELESSRLRHEIQALRAITAALHRAQAQKEVDPRLPRIICAVGKLLE